MGHAANHFMLIMTMLSSTNASYTCLSTTGNKNKNNCVGATPAETKSVFGTILCCKPGSGGAPAFMGFNCACPAVPFGVCVDDPLGLVAQQGMNCNQLKEKGCNTLLSDINTNAPHVTVFSSLVCPRICNACTCKDDSDGELAKQKTSCADVLAKAKKAGGGCGTDLKTLSDKVTIADVKVGNICPATCGACPRGRTLSQLSDAARPLREGLATIGRTWGADFDDRHTSNPSNNNKDNTNDGADNYDDESSSNSGRSLRGFGRGFGGYRGYGYGRGASFATGLAVGGITGAAISGGNNYNNYNTYNGYSGYYTD